MNKSSAMFSIRIEGSFFIYLAFGLLVIPLPWLVAWIIAGIIHELGHVVAVLLSDHRIERIAISCWGAKILTDPLGKSECLCALAGSLFGLLLLSGMHIFPKVSVCALLQSAYNLLPIYPLDGGRALKVILQRAFEEKTVNGILSVIAGGIFAVLIALLYKVFGVGLCLLAVFIIMVAIIKTLIINIPCKARRKWVQ